jgi:signal peptidase II
VVVVLTAAVVVALDQLTKAWAVAALEDRTIHLVWTLRLHLTFNYGSAFSLAQGRGLVLSIVAVVVSAVLLRASRHVGSVVAVVAMGMVVGGALGNLVDRLVREGDGLMGGGVVDFVDHPWWPVFKLADAAIVVGGVVLLLTVAREPTRESDLPGSPG